MNASFPSALVDDDAPNANRQVPGAARIDEPSGALERRPLLETEAATTDNVTQWCLCRCGGQFIDEKAEQHRVHRHEAAQDSAE